MSDKSTQINQGVDSANQLIDTSKTDIKPPASTFIPNGVDVVSDTSSYDKAVSDANTKIQEVAKVDYGTPTFVDSQGVQHFADGSTYNPKTNKTTAPTSSIKPKTDTTDTTKTDIAAPKEKTTTDYLNEYKAATDLTADQNEQVRQAGLSARAEFESAIQEAKNQKASGMPVSIVSGGERGGFMNTQFSGAAAILPTTPGTEAFVGAGGEFERIASNYDWQITTLKQQQAAAGAKAEAAMREYLTTGNKDAFKTANDMYNNAVTAKQNAEKLQIEKTKAISALQKEQVETAKLRTETETAQVKNIAPSIFEQLTGDAKADAAIISEAAKSYGVDENTLRTGMLAYRTDQEKQAYLNTAQVANILKTTKEGGTIKLPNGQTATVLGDYGKTVSYGGKVYRDVNGQLVDTGIKDEQITPSEVLKFFNTIGDTSSAATLMNSLGYNVDVPVGSVKIPESSRLAYVNNNPGNLRFASQPGATMGEGNFAKFGTPEEGFNALINQVKLDQSRNMTVREFVSKYAPSTENDTETYISQFNKNLGTNDNTKIGTLNPTEIAKFMAKKESSTTFTAKSAEKFSEDWYKTDYGQKVLNNEQQYQTNFLSQPVIKDYITTQNKAESVGKILDAGVGGPGDLAMVYEFMKGLDPSSVVRESEYDMAAKSGNIFAGIFSKFNGYLKSEGGFLPQNVKEAFKKIVDTKLEVAQKQYDTLRDQFRKTAQEQGLNPDHVAPDMKISLNKTKDDYIVGQLYESPDKTKKYKYLGNDQFEEVK